MGVCEEQTPGRASAARLRTLAHIRVGADWIG
jgi:hypothetical protein